MSDTPEDLNNKSVKFARYAQALPPGKWIITLTKVTQTAMVWRAEPDIGDLTTSVIVPYNADSSNTTQRVLGTSPPET